MFYASAAFLVTLLSTATPDPGTGTASPAPAVTSGNFTDDPRGVIVTIITTAGVILVALISTRHASKTGSQIPQIPDPSQSNAAASADAVLDYRVTQVESKNREQDTRIDSLERRTHSQKENPHV